MGRTPEHGAEARNMNSVSDVDQTKRVIAALLEHYKTEFDSLSRQTITRTSCWESP